MSINNKRIVAAFVLLAIAEFTCINTATGLFYAVIAAGLAKDAVDKMLKDSE